MPTNNAPDILPENTPKAPAGTPAIAMPAPLPPPTLAVAPPPAAGPTPVAAPAAQTHLRPVLSPSPVAAPTAEAAPVKRPAPNAEIPAPGTHAQPSGGGIGRWTHNRVALAIACFLLGGLAFSVISHRQPKQEPPAPAPAPPAGLSLAQDSGKFFDEIFSRAFFESSRRPFEDMQRIEKSMAARYTPADALQASFAAWYKQRFGGDVTDVTQREDGKGITYVVHLPNVDPKSLKVYVKDSVIHITSGQSTGAAKVGVIQGMDDTPASSSGEAFARAYPIPTFFDQEAYKVETGVDDIAIRFPKGKGYAGQSEGETR